MIRATSVDGSFTDQSFAISIGDQDEFDVGTPTDINAAPNLVAENAATGTVVGVTASATDSDATFNTITYSLDDDAGGRFAIDSVTGVVSVANGGLLDYETSTSHSITVRSTSADGSTTTQTFTIQLTDVNEASVGTISDIDASSNFTLENAAIGSVVGATAWAVDPDGTDTVAYSLDDSAGGRFSIDAMTGVIMVAGPIDREAAASYTITVRATSSDSSSTTRDFTISVGDVDEFDVGAVTDANASSNQVTENAAIGTFVGLTATAVDADATGNALTFSLINNDDGRFSIDANTGVVSVAGAIDREADGGSRSITVRATSADGSFTDQVFTITIADADEFDVSIPVDTNAISNTIAENSASGTVVGVTALANDADATNHTVTYSLDDNAGGRFAIDSVTGVVTVADGTLLDYEAATSHSISILATSSDGSSATQTFVIQLTDVNEAAITAISDSNAANNYVLENRANGSLVGITAAASDADGTATITYSLDDDAGGRFTIDPTTGVVSVAGSIDRETASTLQITVRATSSDASFSTRVFTISVGDVDEYDVGLISDSNPSANVVNENAAVGTVVGITGVAIDNDATNNTISYSLVDSAGGRFAIDAQTGVVTVASSQLLNYEIASSHSVTIRASSSDGSLATQSMVINVADVNEAPTASSQSFTTNSVQTLTVGSAALMNTMSDPDGNSLTVVLASGPTNGVLVLNSDGSFQYSANPGFTGADQFTIQSFDGQLSSAPVTITIVVTLPPVNDTGGTSTGGGATSSSGSSSNSTAESNTAAIPATQPAIHLRSRLARRWPRSSAIWDKRTRGSPSVPCKTSNRPMRVLQMLSAQPILAR